MKVFNVSQREKMILDFDGNDHKMYSFVPKREQRQG